MCFSRCGRPREKFAKECLTQARAALASFGGYTLQFDKSGYVLSSVRSKTAMQLFIFHHSCTRNGENR